MPIRLSTLAQHLKSGLPKRFVSPRANFSLELDFGRVSGRDITPYSLHCRGRRTRMFLTGDVNVNIQMYNHQRPDGFERYYNLPCGPDRSCKSVCCPLPPT